MQDAKCLARGCEATENARGSGGMHSRKNCVIENDKYVISCLFGLYLAPIFKKTIF